MEKLQPKLRFPEFEDNWQTRTFSEFYSFKSTNSLSRENLNYELGSVKNIHYGDIHTKFNSQFDISKEMVPFVNPQIDLTKVSNDNYIKEGDLVIADASEDYNDIGKSIEIIGLNNEKVLSGLHTFLARKESNDIYTGFPTFLLKTRKVRLEIMIIAQGTKVLSLSSNRFGNIFLNLPTLPEQTKIASFLSTVDQKIAGLKKQLTLLERYKKGVMQKIFSQELRFKDENGNDFSDWEEKKLGEVCIKKSSNISANKMEENNGNYIIYGATGVLKMVDFYQEENDFISIVKDGAGVGRLLYCKGFSSVLGTLERICPKANIDTYFLYSLLLNIDFNKYVTGSTIPHIYFKDYSLENCLIPSLSEQQKIASFLSTIDEKIEKCQGQLGAMEIWKKGLLQQMFV